MGALKPWHIIVLVVVLILLFGAKRLPDAARSLGRSLRIIKAETKGLVDDDKDKDNLATKADAQHGYAPLQGEVQQPYQQQQYQQAPPPGYQQPGYQQPAPQPGYQQPAPAPQSYQAPPAQPFVDPVQHRTNDR
ncbi:Sec-independent protein translocase subunit TatA [Actinoplanes sp. G11-F43]|uniref:Sec-independent protein translocase subunit TatA n=1 Tax=Actinoplanes sp. G11-F43 TaxID=3424130 RepID=UPI003D343445